MHRCSNLNKLLPQKQNKHAGGRPAYWPSYVPLFNMQSVLRRAQELCESRGGRPGLPYLINLRFLRMWSNTSTNQFYAHFAPREFHLRNVLSALRMSKAILFHEWIIKLMPPDGTVLAWFSMQLLGSFRFQLAVSRLFAKYTGRQTARK